ncbi:MAG: ethanolamine ammonia-lyase subunit EutC [Pseudolabrys sp.]|nr:ethanolamine ammonia-lyase subunit EutC [Pseudolabrys sp.]
MSDELLPVSPADDDALWVRLRKLTAARIGLKRSGASLATAPLLAFQLAHAQARDAVHQPLDLEQLAADLAGFGLPVLDVASKVEDTQTYLMRPDLGRTLAPDAAVRLAPQTGACDLSIVITGGLSARAVQSHAAPVLKALLPLLRKESWRIAPLVLVRYGRVAIGDAIAGALNADIALVLIGERPGLSAPDSMGVYLTWQPGADTTDADRNCISNIRPEGIGYADAAFKIGHLLKAMRERRLSGIRLKDDSDRLLLGSTD